MKKLLASIIFIYAFANASTLLAQCTIVSCNSPLNIQACDEFDIAILSTSGFAYGSATSLTESNFVNQAFGAVANCATNATYEYIDGAILFNLGNCPYASWSRTWNVYENGIFQSSCIQTINLVDNIPPIITCPSPSILEIELFNSAPCDGSNAQIESETGFVFSPSPTILSDPNLFQASTNGSAIDSPCLIHQISYEDVDNGVSCGTGDPNVAFSFTRTWTVTDKCGNSSSCQREIRLMDFDGPQLQGGSNFFTNQDPDGFNILSVTCPIALTWAEPEPGDFVTNCGSSIVNLTSSGGAPGDLFDIGTTEICYDYEDECGNSGQTCFDITINCPTNCTNGIFTACDQAPINCDVNDLNVSSCTPIPDGSSTPLCDGGAVHNGSYFTFVAGADTLEITITPSNCLSGQGIQAAVTDYCDGTVCYTTNGADCLTTETTIMATGLTVGNVYNVVVDGCNADVCDFSLSINAEPFTLEEPNIPVVSSEVCAIDSFSLNFCLGQVVSFFPDNLEDENLFFCWDISSQVGVNAMNIDTNCTIPDTTLNFSCIGDYTTCGPLELEFNEPGSYQICLLEMDNGCDAWQGDFCWAVVVEANSTVNFGSFQLCSADLENGWDPGNIIDPVTGVNWQGGVVSTSGIHSFNVIGECGCITEHIIEVIEIIDASDDVVDVFWCADEIELWEDPSLAITWDDIQVYLDSTTNSAFVSNYSEGSLLSDYTGMNCDTSLTYNFFLHEVTGSINTTLGSDCSVLLEFVPENLPNFMDPNQITYQWIDPNGMNLGTDITQSVSMDGIYQLMSSYTIPTNGNICTNSFELEVIISSGGTITPPVVSAPPICEDNITDLLFSVPDLTDIIYEWTIINGTPASASGTELSVSITDPSQPLVIEVISSGPCGISEPSINSYNVSPTPFVSVLPDTTVTQGETLVLTASIDMAQEYSWNISDTEAIWDQATAADQQNLPVTWNTVGDQTYSLQVIDMNGCISNLFIGIVTVVDSTSVSVKDEFNENNISIFPNPTTGLLSINSDTQVEKIEVFALNGTSIIVQNKVGTTIDLSALETGVYLIRVTSKEDEYVTKVFRK